MSAPGSKPLFALRDRPELAHPDDTSGILARTGLENAGLAYAYWGNAARGESRLDRPVGFAGLAYPISALLLRPLPATLGLRLSAEVEVADVGRSPRFAMGEIWGVRLKKPITALRLHLEGAAADDHVLSWYGAFKFLGYGDVASSGQWRSGLHAKDPLMELNVSLHRRSDTAPSAGTTKLLDG